MIFKEQPMFVNAEDWDMAIMFGQYSQGDNRDDLVTFNRTDLAAYLAAMRVDYEGRITALKQNLIACKYPLLVAKADADSSGEIEDLEALSSLLRQIDAALNVTV